MQLYFSPEMTEWISISKYCNSSTI